MILIDLIHKLEEMPLKAETATVTLQNDQELTTVEYDAKNNVIRLRNAER